MMRALCLALALAGCSAMPEADLGGNPDLYLARVTAARDEVVPIRGVCFSACALKLAAHHVCVSPTAQIGVHEVRWTADADSYEHGRRDEMWTAFFAARLPECARDLFIRLGGFSSGRLVTVSGAEMLAACSEISSCGA